MILKAVKNRIMKQTIEKYLVRQLIHNQDCARSNVCGINNPELNDSEKTQYTKELKQNIEEIEELIKCIEHLQQN